MTCSCRCKCKNEASGDGNRTPQLCIGCDLCDAWGSDKHGLPYTPTVWKPIEASVRISDEQIDRAIDKAMEGLI